jgi:hypothetical protein
MKSYNESIPIMECLCVIGSPFYFVYIDVMWTFNIAIWNNKSSVWFITLSDKQASKLMDIWMLHN